MMSNTPPIPVQATLTFNPQCFQKFRIKTTTKKHFLSLYCSPNISVTFVVRIKFIKLYVVSYLDGATSQFWCLICRLFSSHEWFFNFLLLVLFKQQPPYFFMFVSTFSLALTSCKFYPNLCQQISFQLISDIFKSISTSKPFSNPEPNEICRNTIKEIYDVIPRKIINPIFQ